MQLANLIVKQDLSVRQVESLVALRTSNPPEKKEETEEPKIDPNVRAAVLEMERTLGTRVKVQGDEKRGKIEISYFSAEDLNRIYELIVKK
jgi:ParB family chromosome partitioning protein